MPVSWRGPETFKGDTPLTLSLAPFSSFIIFSASYLKFAFFPSPCSPGDRRKTRE